MNRLLVVSLFLFARTIQAEIVTVPFNGTVSRIVGAPFGIQAEAGVTHVTGSFQYDTATPPVEVAGNTARFMGAPNGFIINVAGVSITGSSPFVLTQNDSLNLHDVLGANAGRFSRYSSPLAVNGMPVDGHAEMHLVERGTTLFSSDDDLLMLPSQNKVGKLDFDYYSLLVDDSDNFLHISTRVPEPGAVLLVTQLLCIFLFGRHNKQTQQADRLLMWTKWAIWGPPRSRELVGPCHCRRNISIGACPIGKDTQNGAACQCHRNFIWGGRLGFGCTL
jgi:hypothetical protein